MRTEDDEDALARALAIEGKWRRAGRRHRRPKRTRTWSGAARAGGTRQVGEWSPLLSGPAVAAKESAEPVELQSPRLTRASSSTACRAGRKTFAVGVSRPPKRH